MHGNVEVEHLMVNVVHALRDAHMQATLRAFDDRVLTRPAEALFESAAGGSKPPRLKPMVELLIRELIALSGDSTRSLVERHARAIESLSLAGF